MLRSSMSNASRRPKQRVDDDLANDRHDLLPVFEPGRIYLRCGSCLYETEGWTLRPYTPAPGHLNGLKIILPFAMFHGR